MNIRIPRWLHVVILCALAVIGVLTRLLASGQIATTVPLAAILSMVTLLLQSVDPETAQKIVSAAKLSIAVALFGCLFGGLVACSAFQNSKVPSDITTNVDCVAGELIHGTTHPVAIAAACFQGVIVTAVDAIDLLIHSLSFQKANPTVNVAAIGAKLGETRKAYGLTSSNTHRLIESGGSYFLVTASSSP